MALKLYHAEPAGASLAAMIPLFEKGLRFDSVYVDHHKFEQHQPWFLEINPEGEVPVLCDDSAVITHGTVINEYLEDAFPEMPLRPRDPLGAARMRGWTKFVDEQVVEHVATHHWHRTLGLVARGIDNEEFEKLLGLVPLADQRSRWELARSGFPQAQLVHAAEKIEFALDKAEKQLERTPWLAGEEYSLADIAFYAHCGLVAEAMFPEMEVARRAPRLAKWCGRIEARPAVRRALDMPDHTNPALRGRGHHFRDVQGHAA